MYGYLLKIIFRGALRQKGIFAIKVLSFVVAFLFSVFVLEWNHFERNYDKWASDYQQVYRLTYKWVKPGEQATEFAFIFQEWIKEIPGFFPEVEEMVRLEQQHGNIAIKADSKKFNTRSLFGADSNVFEVFDVNFLQGKKDYILDKPKTVAISKSLANKYFGIADCTGQVLECSQTWDSTYTSYQIVGIFEDFPKQSHFHPEIFISFDNPEIYQRRNYVYLKLKKGAHPEHMLARFKEFKQLHIKPEKGYDIEFSLQPVSDIHLHSHKARELEIPGNPFVLKMLIVAVLVLIIIVLINFTNLQIDQFSKNIKLFFIQKTFGSKRKIQFIYLIISSLLVISLSFLFSIACYNWIADLLIKYLGINLEASLNHIVFSFTLLYSFFLILAVLIALYIVFVSGNTHFRLIKSFLNKNVGNELVPKSRTRSLLIIIQAAATISILITSIVAVRQLKFLMKNRLGHGAENVMVMKNLPRVAVDNYITFKHELLKHPDILDVSSTMEEPSGQTNDRGAFIFDGKKEEDKRIYILPVDYNFNSFYENMLIAGEDLSFVSDQRASEKYVINETALRYLGFSKPEEIIGKSFEYLLPFDGFFFPGYISGVVKDFHLSSMEEQTKPLVMYYLTFFSYSFSVKFNEENIPGAVNALSDTWQDLFPEYPLDYYFIDQLYNNVYSEYIIQAKFINIILIIILVISNVGLLAMVTLQINRRIKEIGIRKVNGAKIIQILAFMNRPIVLWILIAMLIASPVTWFVMDKWLDNFAYRINISWWICLFAGGVSLITALITVSYKAFKAAVQNPVDALRYE